MSDKTETELAIAFQTIQEIKRTQQAWNKKKSKREGIEKLNKRCQADVDNVLGSIPNVFAADAPAVLPPNNVLQSQPGIDVLKYIGVRKI